MPSVSTGLSLTLEAVFQKEQYNKNAKAILSHIEFQKQSKYLGYPLPKRGGYYCSRMISKQYGTVFTHSEYGKIRKVYSIWICPNVVADDEDSIVKYRIMPEVVHGHFEPKPEEYDILDITVISLSKEYMSSESRIIRLIGTIFMPLQSFEDKKRTLEDEFGIPMDREIEEDLSSMCNLSDGILEYGEARGISTGKIFGYIEGLQDDGKTKREIMERLMAKYGLKKKEAEKYIEEVIGLQPV